MYYPIAKRMEIRISMFVSFSQINFDYMENGGKKSFTCKRKASISCIPIWKTWYNTHNRLLKVSKFALICKWTLIIRKILERKAFSTKRKHRYIYPYTENMIIVPNNKKNGDYLENPSLSHFTDELWL